MLLMCVNAETLVIHLRYVWSPIFQVTSSNRQYSRRYQWLWFIFDNLEMTSKTILEWNWPSMQKYGVSSYLEEPRESIFFFFNILIMLNNNHHFCIYFCIFSTIKPQNHNEWCRKLELNLLTQCIYGCLDKSVEVRRNMQKLYKWCESAKLNLLNIWKIWLWVQDLPNLNFLHKILYS